MSSPPRKDDERPPPCMDDERPPPCMDDECPPPRMDDECPPPWPCCANTRAAINATIAAEPNNIFIFILIFSFVIELQLLCFGRSSLPGFTRRLKAKLFRSNVMLRV